MTHSADQLTKSFNAAAPKPFGVADIDKKGRHIKTHEAYLVGERVVNGERVKLRGGKVIATDVDGSAKRREQRS